MEVAGSHLLSAVRPKISQIFPRCVFIVNVIECQANIFSTNICVEFTESNIILAMADEGTFYKAVFILGLTFTAGLITGYKVGPSDIPDLKLTDSS